MGVEYENMEEFEENLTENVLSEISEKVLNERVRCRKGMVVSSHNKELEKQNNIEVVTKKEFQRMLIEEQ